jgi:hypothetical protein
VTFWGFSGPLRRLSWIKAEVRWEMENVNVGVLGHVDCGKTSLCRVLSTTGSTAAFDSNPQSRERRITLDLGFSSFKLGEDTETPFPTPKTAHGSSHNDHLLCIIFTNKNWAVLRPAHLQRCATKYYDLSIIYSILFAIAYSLALGLWKKALVW